MKFLRQLKHSSYAALMIVGLVFLLYLIGVIPYDQTTFMHFLIGAVLLIVGQSVFLVAIDASIIESGHLIGVKLIEKKRVWLIILFGFLFGLVTTIAEPDAQVLIGELVGINPFISSFLLLSIFGIGSGLFVSFAMFRILKNIDLKWVFLVIYSIIIILCFFAPESYVGLSFDAGGVSTGSMMVPFLLSLIIGLCAVRSGGGRENSFGAVAIASTGPIIAVLVLGIMFGEHGQTIVQEPENLSFFQILLSQLGDVALALSPLLVIFIISQIFILKLPKKQAIRVFVGFFVSAIGLVLFLTGIYFGFSGMGNFIGSHLVQSSENWFILIFGALLGSILVFTDPATIILVEQVEEVTSGFLKKKLVFTTLAIGVAVAVVLAFVHALYQINILYILAPIYVVCIILAFIIPKIFSSIAFDSGGIAAGTMVVAFILPICVGICGGLGVDTITFAFGTAGLVSTTPILAVELLGLLYMIKTKLVAKKRQQLEENENLLDAITTTKESEHSLEIKKDDFEFVTLEDALKPIENKTKKKKKSKQKIIKEKNKNN